MIELGHVRPGQPLVQGPPGRHRPVQQHHRAAVVHPVQHLPLTDHLPRRRQPGQRPAALPPHRVRARVPQGRGHRHLRRQVLPRPPAASPAAAPPARPRTSRRDRNAPAAHAARPPPAPSTASTAASAADAGPAPARRPRVTDVRLWLRRCSSSTCAPAGSRCWQALSAAWNCGESGLTAAPLAGAWLWAPCPGSGKSGTPWLRMHWAYFSSAGSTCACRCCLAARPARAARWTGRRAADAGSRRRPPVPGCCQCLTAAPSPSSDPFDVRV